MAGSTHSGAHVKNLRESQTHENRDNGISTKGNQSTEFSAKNRNTSTSEIVKQTSRYERSCKYLSLLSTVAALVSVGSTFYGAFRKQRKWF